MGSASRLHSQVCVCQGADIKTEVTLRSKSSLEANIVGVLMVILLVKLSICHGNWQMILKDF